MIQSVVIQSGDWKVKSLCHEEHCKLLWYVACDSAKGQEGRTVTQGQVESSAVGADDTSSELDLLTSSTEEVVVRLGALSMISLIMKCFFLLMGGQFVIKTTSPSIHSSFSS